MKKHTKTFVRLDYDILSIKNLTNTDNIALAYNWGDWGKGGYFATNRYAAGVLGMNIKTFEKSALKLKKLGLWKVRGKFVEPSTSPAPVGDPPTPVGPMPTPVGSPPTRVGCLPAPVGIESAILPLKTEVLLDSLLDNKLEKDKKELLDNAAVAANSNSSSLSLKNSEDIKINQVQSNLDPKTCCNNDASGGYNLIGEVQLMELDPTNHAGPLAARLTRRQMLRANFEAEIDGKPRIFSKEELSATREDPEQILGDFEALFGKAH